MPNILVKIPKGAFSPEQRSALTHGLGAAAATAEQIPDDPKKRLLTWVIIEEVESGAWTCGGNDVSERMLPCLVVVYVPAGVLDGAARARFVELAHAAFQQALPASEQRRLATSVVLHDVVDGTWGANGTIFRLPEFARAAGFMHLQSLIAGT